MNNPGTPAFTVCILDFRDKPVEIRYITLLVWIKALELRIKTGLDAKQGIVTTIRRHLHVPKSSRITLEDLLQHLKLSKEDIDQQINQDREVANDDNHDG